MAQRSFSEGKYTGGEGAKPTVVRPGRYPNGDEIMGTPQSNVHGRVKDGYLSAAQRKQQAALRGDPIRDNPTVHSKATKRYGNNPS